MFHSTVFSALIFSGQTLAAPPRQPSDGHRVSPALQARATATATPVLVNCPVWPDPLAQLNFDPQTCVQYGRVAGEKGGTARIYQEIGPNGVDQHFVDTTRNALARTLSFYAGNLQRYLNVSIILAKPDRKITDENFLGLTDIKRQSTGNPCYVVVRRQPDLLLNQTIAHELYHCVQLQERPESAGQSVLFEDSAANFFAYFLYPWKNPDNTDDDNGDRGAPHHYNPSEALYAQKYQASLFYMYRHNRGQTVVEMDRWITKHEVDNDDMALKRRTLAGDSALADAFAKFAVYFHNKRIMYDSFLLPERPVLVTSQPVAQTTKDINLAAVGQSGEQKVDDLLSWSFQKYSIRLAPGQAVSGTVSWQGTPAPKVVVWRRVVPSGKPPSGWSRFRSGVLQSGCDAEGILHEFLVVPVAEAERVSGTIRFVRDEDAKCKCPGKTPGQGPVRRSLEKPDLQVRQGGNGTGTQTPQTTLTVRPPASQLQSEPSRIPATPTAHPTTGGFVTPTPEAPQHPTGGDGEEPGWTQDSEGPWSRPGPEEDIIEESNDPADGQDEEDLSCHEPALSGPSCVIGRWVANKASMDAHMGSPYYYWTGGSQDNISSISGSYTISFGQNTSGSGEYMTVPIHEKLVELQLLTEIRTGKPSSHLNTTTFTEGAASLQPADDTGFNPAGPETGYITRHETTMNFTGSTLVTPPEGGAPFFTFPYLPGTGPRGIYFTYTCTASTLYYNRTGSYARSYVFDRV